MTLLRLTARVANNFHSPDGIPSQSERELTALKGTALDIERYPILACHFWKGPLIVGGKLCCHDDSPLASRFATAPVNSNQEPGR